jgi:dienelactone hydrolase
MFSAYSFSQVSVLPSVDRRAVEIRRPDTNLVFEPPKTREEWIARARYLRQQILVSAGLWPLPEKTPLNPQIFGRIEREGYSVEKVYFEAYPGFYVTGNLYRPLGKAGPFPAVLTPHAHWTYGRLENNEVSSVPARCISFARQGYVVFSYDMVGYNDSRQVDHYIKRKNNTGAEIDPEVGRPLSLWGMGTLPLQLWNGIRSLDFLESLPDVDRDRIAATGASGGATQTFILAAVDDRVKFAAPVNMISFTMQGGCTCENTSDLRLDTSNVELGALLAPRPLLMVSATGDWTRETMRSEYPAIRSVYQLLAAEDRVNAVQFDAPHNYNRDSREAVYRWFGQWILGQKDEGQFREKNFRVEMPSQLLVFYGRALPDGAKTQEQLFAYLKESSELQLQRMKPKNAESLSKFREVMLPALEHSLAASYPDPRQVTATPTPSYGQADAQEFFIGRRGKGDRVPAKLWFPRGKAPPKTATLIVHPRGIEAVNTELQGLLTTLLKKGHLVMSIDAFNTGSASANRDTSSPFFTTYNRTDDANRVQDILTALALLKREGVARLNLVGVEEAGLWSLLARSLSPELEQTAADVAQFKTREDQSYLDRLYIPLIRRAGDFRTAVTLAGPSRLLIHNTGTQFETEWALDTYRIEHSEDRLRVEQRKLSQEELTLWLK